LRVFRGLKPELVDERGGITMVLDDGKTIVKSVLLITSRKGAVRANHYHKTDSHYSYLLSGRMEYSEQPVSKEDSMEGKKEYVVLEASDMVFSAPMVAYAMKFLEDSVFLALATESRHQTEYERDTVRVKVI
jgi:dTDP-4-dehydrorhamnose 3,5-epimerase-like enzyme